MGGGETCIAILCLAHTLAEDTKAVTRLGDADAGAAFILQDDEVGALCAFDDVDEAPEDAAFGELRIDVFQETSLRVEDGGLIGPVARKVEPAAAIRHSRVETDGRVTDRDAAKGSQSAAVRLGPIVCDARVVNRGKRRNDQRIDTAASLLSLVLGDQGPV